MDTTLLVIVWTIMGAAYVDGAPMVVYENYYNQEECEKRQKELYIPTICIERTIVDVPYRPIPNPNDKFRPY